jgi:hypothetical protein
MDVILVPEGDSVVVRIPTEDTDIYQLAASIVNCKIVDSSDLPKDSEFRSAWTMCGTIDIKKAKEIWKNKIRKIRKNLLEKLDVAWIRTMECGKVEDAIKIVELKKQLRDLTDHQDLKNAKTVEEIRAFWPPILEGNYDFTWG